MQHLLNLPHELRLQIYEYALCDQLLEIDVGEYWSDRDPNFWEQMAEPLAKLDPALASDITALHWSRVAIVYSEFMRASVPTSDQKFVFWLFNHADAVRDVLGGLKFLEVSSYSWYHSDNEDCIDIVEINFRNGELTIWDTNHRPGACSHANAVRSLMTTVLDKMPRGHGRLQPRIGDLWDLYEIWRLQFLKKPQFARTWESVRLEYTKVFRCQTTPNTRSR
jgi:hypothetical protein